MLACAIAFKKRASHLRYKYSNIYVVQKVITDASSTHTSLPRCRGSLHYSSQGITLSLPPGWPQSAVPLELSWTVLNRGIKWEGETGKVREKGKSQRRSNCSVGRVCFPVSTVAGWCTVTAMCFAQMQWPLRVYLYINTSICHFDWPPNGLTSGQIEFLEYLKYESF